MKNYCLIWVLSLFLVGKVQGNGPVPASGLQVTADGEDPKKKEDDEGEKKTKTKYKPHIAAKTSAKQAKYSAKMKDKEIDYRAKVRNIYHHTFNRKHGKPVNFRSKAARHRWKRHRN